MADWEGVNLMLEAKTIKLVNELIRGMVGFCIEIYKSNHPIAPEDLKVLGDGE